MTKMQRDIPSHEGETVADRLKFARDEAKLTRKALSEATGIPYSSIEKYERGDMDPNTTRLQTICETLNITVNWVLNGDDEGTPSEDEETAEILPSEDLPEGYSKHHPAVVTEPDNEGRPTEKVALVSALLERIDGFRTEGFRSVQRGVFASVDEIRNLLKYMEPEELLTVASSRNLFDGECPSPGILEALFQDEPENARTQCGNIEERIIDTAFFGIDLYEIEIDALQQIGDAIPENISLQRPDGWNTEWSEEHEVFIPYVRNAFRTMVMTGLFPDVGNAEKFPRRADESVLEEE